MGSIIGGIITLAVLSITLNVNKKERIQNEKMKFYDGIIKDIVEFDLCLKNMIEVSKNEKNKSLESVKNFNQKALLIKLKFEIENERRIHKDIEKPIKLLNDLLNCADEINQQLMNDSLDGEDCAIKLMRLRLCTDGFIKQTKDMIVENTLNGNDK